MHQEADQEQSGQEGDQAPEEHDFRIWLSYEQAKECRIAQTLSRTQKLVDRSDALGAAGRGTHEQAFQHSQAHPP